jgi:hypothetical protein
MISRHKKELNYIEDQLNKFGPQWNLFGALDGLKESVRIAKFYSDEEKDILKRIIITYCDEQLEYSEQDDSVGHAYRTGYQHALFNIKDLLKKLK